jgi:hypothetical protein
LVAGVVMAAHSIVRNPSDRSAASVTFR